MTKSSTKPDKQTLVDKIFNAFKNNPVTAPIIVLFIVITALSSLIDLPKKLSQAFFPATPYANISIHAPTKNGLLIDIPSSKLTTIPLGMKDKEIKWIVLPIKVEFVNPTSESVSFRSFQLTSLNKERDGIAACQNADYFKEEKYKTGIYGSGVYMWIVKDKSINPEEKINTPINLEAKKTATHRMDFLMVPILPAPYIKDEIEKFKSDNVFCLRWIDESGKKYLSKQYIPLDFGN